MADFLNLLGSALGTTPPSYMEGLLGQQATEDLQKRSIGTGIANALIGYMAMPKNQNLGLGRILAGAAQAGIGGAQGVYGQALEDYQTQAKVAEMQRKQREQQIAQNAIGDLLKNPTIANDPLAVAYIRSNPMEALKTYATPKERKTATVGNVVVDTSTGLPIYTGEKDLKAPPTRTIPQGRSEIVQELQPDGTWKTLGTKFLDAAKEPKALYSNTPIDTGKGYAYMPTADGLSQGMKPIDAATGKPITYELTGKTKAPTDQQLLSTGFLMRMQSAEDIMKSQVTDPRTKQLITLEQAAGSDFWNSPYMTSDLRKQYRQAQEDWVRAKLRKESGAVIGDNEMQDEINTYFPTWHDDATTIAQKAYARKVAGNAMGISAGNENVPMKAFRKTFTINKKAIPAQLGSDNNYYYSEGGKTYRVEE